MKVEYASQEEQVKWANAAMHRVAKEVIPAWQRKLRKPLKSTIKSVYKTTVIRA